MHHNLSKSHYSAKSHKIFPIYLGEVLFENFLKPMNISQNQLARDLGVFPRRINEIVNCKRSITADTALRLAACFGNSPSFQPGLQMDYDLDVAEDALSSKIKKVVLLSNVNYFVRSASIILAGFFNYLKWPPCQDRF